MANYKKYNIFIVIQTLARNIFEIFSSVFLYQKGYSLKSIMLFYFLLYFIGILVNYISLRLVKYINGKYILIASSLLFGYSFYFLSNMSNSISNLIIFSVLFSFASYMYHSLRHYYALSVLPDKDKSKKTFNILIFSYLSLIIAPYIGSFITDNYGLNITVIICVILSMFGTIPLFIMDKFKVDKSNISIKNSFKKLPKNKLLFFILEQFKVIFLSLQPLYLYLYVSDNLKYIGVFNIILGIASVIFLYLFVRRINLTKNFLYLNIILVIILLFKINIYDKNILLFLAFFEGLFIKMYETVSLTNIYNKDKGNIINYLIVCEFIFCFVRSILCLIGFFINDIKIILYIMIVGIFTSSFVKLKVKN